jgi:flagellar hook-associated protein 3 FlgL
MSLRISTSQMQERAVDKMLQLQTQLSHTQQQVATGKQILTPADNPAGAAHALALDREIAVTNQYQTNADVATNRQTREEDVLSNATDVLQRVSELVVQGNNDTNNSDDRQAIATELQQRLDELLGLANTRDANGEYIFAGFQANEQPFTQNGAGDFSYNGDQGQRFMTIGPGVQVAMTDSGADIFQRIRAGNGVFTAQPGAANTGTGVITAGSASGTFVPATYKLTFSQATATDPVAYQVLDGSGNPVAGASGTYVSGADITFNGAQVAVTGSPADGDSFTIAPSGHQDVFTTVYNLAQAFANAGDTPEARAQLHNSINQGLAEIQGALENVSQARTRIGSRMNTIDSQKDGNDAYLLSAQTTLSSVQDLDYADAVSRLQLQLTGLQAAQQTYLKIQGLALFNYF